MDALRNVAAQPALILRTKRQHQASGPAKMARRVRIDPHRLLDLLSVARHGSFSAAASVSNVSQPGLSRSIAVLEQEVGATLLERGRQGARLNTMGRTLIFYAEALEALLDRARDEVHLRTLGLEGSENQRPPHGVEPGA